MSMTGVAIFVAGKLPALCACFDVLGSLLSPVVRHEQRYYNVDSGRRLKGEGEQ